MFRPETDWLSRWARYTPQRMVLRDHERGVEWTYAEADARAEALVRHLESLGLARGDRIAVFSRNRSELFFLFFACVKLGTVLVPLNFRLTGPEIATLMRDCEPSLLLVEDEIAAPIEGIEVTCRKQAVDSLTPFLYEDADGARMGTSEARDEDVTFGSEVNRETVGGGHPAITRQKEARKPASPADLVMILYTSGTTGVPKGAMVTHQMLFWNSVNTGLRLDLNSADHTQSYAPLFHTGGWNVLFTPFLHHGASHTVLTSFDPDLVLELIEKERSTLLFGVPTMLQMLVDSPRFETTDLSSLRYAIVGGAPMPLPLIEIWHGRGVAIRQGYGLTEVGPNCFSLHQDDAARKRGSIGFPNFYIDARIVGPDGEDCGVDEPGELWLRSPVVTPGYWRKPEETAASKTGEWFQTGDMMRKDTEGFFYVVDRKKNMFISGGENVYPAEVESVLGAHPAVLEAAVVGVPDERWGEVGLAFIVIRDEAGGVEAVHASPEELQRHCETSLARYKIPKQFRFLDRLPRNEAGKIDRKALTQESKYSQEDVS